jgi:DNA-binding NarL/FixJ family response regulator
MIRLLLVDDQILTRHGLKVLLRLETAVEIVGEAEQGQAALAQIPILNPDVVLMDVRMPIMDGVAATREIKQRFPCVNVLVLTTFDDTEYVIQAMQYGASGYLLKDTPIKDLVQVIQLIHKGHIHIGPDLFQKLMTASRVMPAELSQLTRRQQQILELIAEGRTNREIAQKLCIEEKTVKNHVSGILERLGLRDRTNAAIFMHSPDRSCLKKQWDK